MRFTHRIHAISGAAWIASGALGATGAALLGLTHPATAVGVVAAAVNAVTCATTGTTPCFSGTNTNSGIGVLGVSNTGTGVRGRAKTNIGVKGTSDSSYGVYGGSQSGIAGVFGINASGAGVEGVGSGDAGQGVAGFGDSGLGIFGQTKTGIGTVGFSPAGIGGSFQGGTFGLVGSAPSTGTPFILTDDSLAALFSVDGHGNVAIQGTLTSFARTAGVPPFQRTAREPRYRPLKITERPRLVAGTSARPIRPELYRRHRSGRFVSRFLDAQWRHARIICRSKDA